MIERQREIKELLQKMGDALHDRMKAASVDAARAVAEADAAIALNASVVKSAGGLTHSFDTSEEHELAVARLDLLSAFEMARFDLFVHVLLELVTLDSQETRSRLSKVGTRIADEFDQLAIRILASKTGDDLSLFGLQLSGLCGSIAKGIAGIPV